MSVPLPRAVLGYSPRQHAKRLAYPNFAHLLLPYRWQGHLTPTRLSTGLGSGTGTPHHQERYRINTAVQPELIQHRMRRERIFGSTQY